MSDTLDLDDNFIDKLCACEKKIVTNPSPKGKSNGLHKETSFDMESSDGQYKFVVFIREHSELMEHFSIGLLYVPEGGKSVVIVRYNGNHGVHKNFLTGEVLEGCCHIHRYKSELKAAEMSTDNHACCTDSYTSSEEAIKVFFHDLKVINYLDYYPELVQESLGI